MTVKNLIVAILSLVGANALADPSMSEFFYQTPAGKSVGTIQAGYIDREYKVLDNNGNAVGMAKDRGLTQAGLRYEAGLNDIWSLEGAVTYSYINRVSAANGVDDGQVNGLDDVQVNLKGTYSVDGFRWRYGAANRIGIFPATYGDTGGGPTNNFNYNASSGRYTFTPYLGVDFDAGGSNIMGAKVSYDLLKGDVALHSPGGIVNYGGGQDFVASVFYEWSLQPSLIGLSVDYFNEGPATLGTTQLSGWAGYGANLYARFGYTDSWTIIPSVAYDVNVTKSNVDMYAANRIDNGNAWKFNVALRYAFR